MIETNNKHNDNNMNKLETKKQHDFNIYKTTQYEDNNNYHKNNFTHTHSN